MQRRIEIDSPELKVERIELEDGEAFDPNALIEQVMHDCPQCRAMRELGEEPLIAFGEDLFPKRDVIRKRRLRWRNLRRSVRR